MNGHVVINGNVFTFNSFVINPEKYLPLIQQVVRGSAFEQKESETDIKYFKRLFNLVNRRFGVDAVVRACTPVEVNKELETYRAQILNSLGINIIKYNPKISKVMFKNSGNSYRMKNADMDAIAEAIKKSVNFKRNKINVCLGVELEFVGNKDKECIFEEKMIERVGKDKFENKGCYNKNDGKKWILGKDSSVEPTESYVRTPMRGYELTSPILKFGNKEDIKELEDVINLVIEVMDGHTNNSCGTHVHMSFTCCNDIKVTDELVKHFAKSYRESEENLFDKLVQLRRRKNNSRWCRATRTGSGMYSRYQKLNFANVKLGTRRMHLEFRQLDGTLDFNKIYTWIKLQKMFIELTMDSWNESCEEHEFINQLNINEVVTDKDLNQDEIESLMKMSKLVA